MNIKKKLIIYFTCSSNKDLWNILNRITLILLLLKKKRIRYNHNLKESFTSKNIIQTMFPNIKNEMAGISLQKT